jgi:transposase
LNAAIILAFCWAHVRRDFLEIAAGYPALKEWALDWVDDIGTLYHLNHQRLAQWQKELPLAEQSSAFQQEQKRLESRLEQMITRCDLLLQADQAAIGSSPAPIAAKTVPSPERRPGELHLAQRQVLTSLRNHWQGLIVFATYPEVPMDNNPAEQAIRNPVLGRNNYYGSGSIWSAELAAMMFSLFQTLGLWKINQRHWLHEYLNACALLGGNAPADLTPFLPWRMSEERRAQLTKPIPIHSDSS